MGGRGALATAMIALVASTACGSSSIGAASAPDAESDARSEVAPPVCAPGELLADDGHCEPAGVPPSACGKGFEADGHRGCRAILPSDPCAAGTMALPGETSCREVAPCGGGTFGDVPVEADTQFVDGSFAGATSDGSKSAPWKTIQKAIAAAAPHAIVAVAAGSYAEDLRIEGKPVRLWGKCPGSVEIVGSASAPAAVIVGGGASGAELHTLAVRGGAVGIVVSGSVDVVVDRAWVHDTSGRGVDVEVTLGAARVSVVGSLVERALQTGVYVGDAEARLESTIVRDTRPVPTDTRFGAGIFARNHTGTRSKIDVVSCIVERNPDVGIFAEGSNVTIEATLVRDSQPHAADKTLGRGVEVEDGFGQPSSLTMRSTVIERTLELALAVFGRTDATVEDTVVRDTQPQIAGQTFGRGVACEGDVGRRPNLVLRACLVDASHDIGIHVDASDATIESTIVRDTAPVALDGTSGRGIDVQLDRVNGERSTATIRATIVEGSRDAGIDVWTSDVTLDGVLVRDTKARASDALFGDGLSIVADGDAASATVIASRIESSARAGVASFGGEVKITSTTLECDGLPLDGETNGALVSTFEDDGGNACGCSGVPSTCQILSSGLASPEPAPTSPH